MHISVKSDLHLLNRKLTHLEKKQIPFATVLAINDTAIDIRGLIYAKMKQVFDRPSSFTVPKNIKKATNKKGSLYLVPAGKRIGRRTAEVGVKGSAWNWIGPNLTGGPRKPKPSETALRSKGIIGANKFITPSSKSKYGSVSMNRFGNVTRGMMIKVLSGLKALRGAAGNIESRQRAKYFTMRLGGPGSETGIWKKSGKSITKLFNVTRQPQYTKLFDFERLAIKFYRLKFPKNFERALKNIMRMKRLK